MMDEVIFSLLLTTRQGLSLPGTLRYDYADPEQGAASGDLATLLAESLQRPRIEVVSIPLKGTLSLPLLDGGRPVPLSGFALVTPAAPLTTLFTSDDPTRAVNLQFNSFNLREIFGGLVWRQGQPGQLVFSLIGIPLPFGLQDAAA
jgi:hypothetical protein